MADEIVIVECGMITPVGLSAKETAASTRSRTARLTASELRDRRLERFTVGLIPDDGLPELHPELQAAPLTYREARMLRLADAALTPVLARLPASAAPVPLLIGLPELHTLLPVREAQFPKQLRQQSSPRIDAENSRCFSRGRAAGLVALAEAQARLRSGQTPFVIAGGVDTQVDLYILGLLESQKRVRNDVNPDGFAPGEGAAFLLLTTREIAGKHQLPILARLAATGQGTEPGHLYSQEPYKAEGLAGAFELLFQADSKLPPVATVYASFNGEHYWAKEYGVAMIRHKAKFREPVRVEHPAECFGDLGAAHGAALAALAALEAKSPAGGSPALVYASSDYGHRAAAVLTAA